MAFIFRSKTTYEAIHQLLNAEHEEEKDRLTKCWRDNKLEELNFVGIVGGLLANTLSSTNSWPNLLETGVRSPWFVRACWFSGMTLSIFSVITAASQAIRLHRLSCRQDSLRAIRRLLSMRRARLEGETEILPRRRQVLVWQLSVVFLIAAGVVMIVGLQLLAWDAAVEAGFWSGSARLAATFSGVTGIAVLLFIWEQVELFDSSADMGHKRDEEYYQPRTPERENGGGPSQLRRSSYPWMQQQREHETFVKERCETCSRSEHDGYTSYHQHTAEKTELTTSPK